MLRSDGSHPWPLEDRVAHLAKVASESNALYLERCWIANDSDGFTGWRWEKYNKQLRIVCAANRYGNFIVPGTRHFSVTMNAVIDLIGLDALRAYAGGLENEEQGFIDQFGTFHNRQDAARIAVAAGQVLPEEIRGGTLFSEELY